MTTNDRFEATVARWLEAGPTSAPEEAITAALRHAEAHPHRGGIRAAILRAMPTTGVLGPARPALRFAWLVVVAGLLGVALTAGALVAGLGRPAPVPASASGMIAVAWDGDIWTVDVATGSAANVTGTPDVLENAPAFSPDGRLLAFTAGEASQGTDTLRDALVLARADGSDRRTLVDDRSLGDDPTVTWSPDGRVVAAGGQEGAVYWDVQADERLVSGLPGAGSGGLELAGGWPAFSPDGTRIAYVGFDGTVRVLRLEDATITALPVPTGVGAPGESASSWGEAIGPPAWTPDGRLVVFDVLSPGDHVPCVADPTTGVVRTSVTVTDSYPAEISVNPGGDTFALAVQGIRWVDATKNTNGELVLGSIASGSVDRLAIAGLSSDGLRNPPIAWSPDGRLIAILERVPDPPAFGPGSVMPFAVAGWRIVLYALDGSADPLPAWDAPGSCTLSRPDTCPRPYDIDWTPAVAGPRPDASPSPAPTGTAAAVVPSSVPSSAPFEKPTPTPPATPGPCLAIATFQSAVSELHANNPWVQDNVTVALLRDLFEEVRTTAIDATATSSGPLRSYLLGTVPEDIEVLGALMDGLGSAPPRFGSAEAYPFEEAISQLDEHARMTDRLLNARDCQPADPPATPQAIVSLPLGGADASCSTKTGTDGSDRSVSFYRAGKPWVRVAVSTATRPTVGGQEAAPGSVFLEANVTYEALGDGVFAYGDPGGWTIAGGPWIYAETGDAKLVENTLPASAPLARGDHARGRLVYEVPATGVVELNVPALVPETGRTWRYWTLPPEDAYPRIVGCVVHPFVLRSEQQARRGFAPRPPSPAGILGRGIRTVPGRQDGPPEVHGTPRPSARREETG